MRLWSISPAYLDKIGLIALWRETLLAQKVLKNETIGYRCHPQLNRFRECHYPHLAIGQYLTTIWEEACFRNYKFDSNLIDNFYVFSPSIIQVADHQLRYEFVWLQQKLSTRDQDRWLKNYRSFDKDLTIHINPTFMKVTGPIASWEKVETVEYAHV